MSQSVEKIIDYEFSDKELLRTAITHGSSGRSGFMNERLETLGDAVITLVVTEELFRHFPDADEGGITRKKSALVSSRVLAAIAVEAGIIEHARTGGEKGRRLPSRISANIFEALMGAVYLDGGLDAARAVILRLFGKRIKDPRFSRVDPKSRLQHVVQRERRTMPVYEVVGVSGPPHARRFRVRVVVAGRAYPEAGAASKRAAERKAAELALREMKRTGVPSDADD